MSEGLYTETEVARLQEAEAKVVLKGLVRNLEDVLAQRIRAGKGTAANTVAGARLRGEIWGLRLAIQAAKRRIK